VKRLHIPITYDELLYYNFCKRTNKNIKTFKKKKLNVLRLFYDKYKIKNRTHDHVVLVCKG